jgi:hypothetical protein
LQLGCGRPVFDPIFSPERRPELTADEAAKPPIKVGKTRLISMSDLDRRTKAAQVALETREAIISDLGGADQLSTLERLAAEHAALSAAVTQDAYARWLQGQEVSLPEIATIQNVFLRIAGALGFSRRARDVTPDLSSYLARAQKTAEGPTDVAGRPEPS